MITILIILFLFIVAILIWALLGKGGDKTIAVSSETELPDKAEKPEAFKKLPGRRAGQEFPTEAEPGEEDREESFLRRKEDIEEYEKMKEVDEDFQLPYTADEIIPEGSRYWIYHKTLANSEIFAKKGNFPTAISLYRGVYERVIDQEINSKIKTNVDYLQEYQKLQLQRKSEAIRQKSIDRRGKEIRFSVDGPLTIPEKIQIAVSSPVNTNKLIEDYKSEIADLKKNFDKFDVNKLVDNVAEKLAAKQESGLFKEEIDRYKSEIEDIKEHINKLQISREEEAAASLEEIDSKLKELAEKSTELPRLKDALLNMHERISDLQNVESEKPPALTEAKYQGPVIQFDPKAEEAPEPKKVDLYKDKRDSGKGVPEGPEEIEILSRPEQGALEDELTALSDDDIFEKILREDVKKTKDDSFEILGYQKEDRDYGYGVIDKEQEEKQLEEERFYRKFLSQGKRIRKELPILKVSYDFSKLPDEFSLSEDQNILQYSFYKYKPMLEKANELIKRKNVRDAINYYNVVKEQNIPPEFKVMLNTNINELREYIEKYLSSD